VVALVKMKSHTTMQLLCCFAMLIAGTSAAAQYYTVTVGFESVINNVSTPLDPSVADNTGPTFYPETIGFRNEVIQTLKQLVPNSPIYQVSPWVAVDRSSVYFNFTTTATYIYITFEVYLEDYMAQSNVLEIFFTQAFVSNYWRLSSWSQAPTGLTYFSIAPEAVYYQVLQPSNTTGVFTYTIDLPSDVALLKNPAFTELLVFADSSYSASFSVQFVSYQPYNATLNYTAPAQLSIQVTRLDAVGWTFPIYVSYAATEASRGVYSNWTANGDCSVSCGQGFETWSRQCVALPTQGTCLGVAGVEETRNCVQNPCPVPTPEPPRRRRQRQWRGNRWQQWRRNRYMNNRVQRSNLTCYTCQSSISNQDCIRNGQLQLCAWNQDSCENTVRINNGRMEIHKGCKEANACENNQLQNTVRKSWGVTQCSFGYQTTTCRCCCQTTMCNSRPLYCANADQQAVLQNLELNPINQRNATQQQTQRNQARIQQQQVVQQQQPATGSVDAHPCTYNPCSNGGTCVKAWGRARYRCRCKPGWRDSHCNTPVSVRQPQYSTRWYSNTWG